VTELDPGAADLLIGTFFQKWAPAKRDDRARFQLDFVRVVQQITLEAARPYHMLLRDALAQQPLMSREALKPPVEPT
jgi:hypothetical protein